MHIEVTGVTFSYDSRRVLLDSANMSIAPGDVVAIMGPSGVGKSTLLSLIGGLLFPSSGAITWDGRPPDVRRADLLSWVLQTVNAMGHRSALDNVMLGLYAQGAPWHRARPKARDMLDRVGLAHCIDRRANDLSGGELQRMVIARALVGEPSLILADEPTGQLDADNSRIAIDCLMESRATSTVVVFATHDPLVVRRSHRVFVIESGGIHETEE